MERTPSRTRCRDCQSRVVGTFCELDERNCTYGEVLDGKLTEIGRTVDGIKQRVGEQNGRIGKLEAVFTMHDGHDTERHEDMKAAVARLEERIG